jgi:TonB-dependent receptor-like protein
LPFFPAERQTRWAFYWQDIWRATPKLTFNYGVRYDYHTPVTPRLDGQLANFDLGSGDILLGGLGDVSRSAGVKRDLNNFAPRLGLAYQLTQKTVVRAGFGRSFFGSNYGGVFYHLTSFYPIADQQRIQASDIYFPIFTLDQPVPQPAPPSFPSDGRLKAPPGTTLKHRPFNHPSEYVDSWNLTLEHQIAQDFRVSVAYVGNVGRQLWETSNINAAPAGPGDLQSRRPYYQKFGLDSAIIMGCNCSSSNYHAMQFSAEKRFSKGYSFNSSYTWAKALDHQLGGFGWGEPDRDPYNRAGAYGISTYNRASVWTLGHTWVLPYGQGMPFGNNAKGVKRLLLEGWNFNGVTTVESGFPISPRSSTSANLNGDFPQRPDAIGNPKLENRTRDLWYDPAAFTTDFACCRWGNAGRSTIRGPGLASADWALWKEFRFSSPLNEDTRLQFRWENYNTFNRTQLGPPNNTVDSSLAGRITTLAGAGGGFGVLVPMRRMQFGLRLSW